VVSPKSESNSWTTLAVALSATSRDLVCAPELAQGRGKQELTEFLQSRLTTSFACSNPREKPEDCDKMDVIVLYEET
jgi:hypothetical protein